MLPQQWTDRLPTEIAALAAALFERAAQERQNGYTIYPSQENIFRAFQLLAPDDVTCVILGQDPYHEEGQAHGLSFSVPSGTPLPPSLRNIYKELTDDLGVSAPQSGDLTPWAGQGVLLLNTVLTVEQGKANSHANWGWQRVTTDALRILTQKKIPPVFILWGGHAKKTAQEAGVDLSADNVLLAPHPSPLSSYRGFFGSKPFSATNRILSTPIQWV